ncbi:adenosyl-hopene transferase HpnH [Paraburkholderia megapolitana]|uniref:adenosyl-hopene transferase HpnH n=1 Tax=Paraburkholderia megapolitana TaxID=420953 RepID=UPI0038B8ED0D
MAVPISQAWTVATYVLKQKLLRRSRYPLVLMLEPLMRCNLACAGCGKIQYPAHVLKSELTPEQCFKAVEECGTPMVAIPGGEPLLHPQMPEIVAGLVARKKYVYMCTNALLLAKQLHLFKPSKYLSFSVHVDGQREHHDFAVCREGGYDIAMEGVRAAVAAGFRVTTNTTLFDGADPNSVRLHFDEMMTAGVESMMVSPGYTYDKAPDQKHFLGRARSKKLFRAILSNRKKSWRFNASPIFMEFLMGKKQLTCTPWGMPTYSIFGWQKPCYLLQDGYADTFDELMESVKWSEYGTESGNPKCANCMVHSGYEASGVNYTFGSFKGLFQTVKAMVLNSYKDPEANEILAGWKSPSREVPMVFVPTPPRAAQVADTADAAQTAQPAEPVAAVVASAPAPAPVNPDQMETAEGTVHEKLEGWTPPLTTEAEVREALEKAFDYRGDVTITRKNGVVVKGYLYDRQYGAAFKDCFVRIIPTGTQTKEVIPYADIAVLGFTGKDTAAGKTFESWVKRYWEKKAAGEKNIQIEPEYLGE